MLEVGAYYAQQIPFVSLRILRPSYDPLAQHRTSIAWCTYLRSMHVVPQTSDEIFPRSLSH